VGGHGTHDNEPFPNARLVVAGPVPAHESGVFDGKGLESLEADSVIPVIPLLASIQTCNIHHLMPHEVLMPGARQTATHGSHGCERVD
jgi:hypothetical protein